MKSISEFAIGEIIVNKSKFITVLTPLNNLNEINDIIKDIQKKYSGATHYCYAYKFDNYKKFNDDGEPSGTAGMPILNVLDNNDLNNIICVVVRYFGGIKLGAGGLVRAYTKAVTSTLDNASIITLEKGNKITITFNYDNLKQVDYLLKDFKIISKNYDDIIKYIFYSKDTEILNAINKLIINSEIEDNLWI